MKLKKYYNRKRLTLDELCSIFMGDTYKAFREECNLSVESLPKGRKFVPVIMGWPCTDVSPLLYRHIVAEQLLQGDYHKIDWDIVYDRCRFFAMLELWFRPLEWVDANDYPDIVTEGRIAREKYDPERPREINELLNYIGECTLLDFADNIYTYKEDSYDTGHMKGMHEWGRLTTDDSEIFDKIINGKHATYEEIVSCKYYDVGSTRAGLKAIAEKRGGKRAAELLHMLQDEWPKIKIWKTKFDTMTPEDIEQFEDGLFHGFDDLLEEWEGKSPYDPKKLPPKGKYKELALWLEEEKKEGRDHYLDANNNRTQMCKNISEIVGWDVKENSLQKQQNKN